MGVKVESEDKVTGVGYYRSSIYTVRDILEHVADGSLPGELEESEPSYSRYDDSENFKITITVENL